jgi:hypothetical protein
VEVANRENGVVNNGMPIKSDTERPATELNPEKQESRVTVQGGETTENKPVAEQ